MAVDRLGYHTPGYDLPSLCPPWGHLGALEGALRREVYLLIHNPTSHVSLLSKFYYRAKSLLHCVQPHPPSADYCTLYLA